MNEKKRLPKKHVETIVSIAREMAGQPRYAIARALTNRLKDGDASISMKTALDYVNAAVNEGHLVKRGDVLLPGD